MLLNGISIPLVPLICANRVNLVVLQVNYLLLLGKLSCLCSNYTGGVVEEIF